MRIGITERGDAALDQSWRLKASSVDGMILITKAPHILAENIPSLPKNSIIHCTITGLGMTDLEPGVTLPSTTIPAYHRLVAALGSERVVLRIDPIIPHGEYLELACSIAGETHGRLRVSFIDAYPHVKARLAAGGLDPREIFPYDGFHAPADMRFEALGKIISAARVSSIEICGEPDMPCTGCVSARDLTAMGLGVSTLSGNTGHQRTTCACLAEKTELLSQRKPCGHRCVYCYWSGGV